MEFATAKIFLIVGSHGCGKTSLARRISEGAWDARAKPTIGLDQDFRNLFYTNEKQILHYRLVKVIHYIGRREDRFDD